MLLVYSAAVEIAFLYDLFSLIDEHNKACKNSLSLENCLTKDCWSCSLMDFFGRSVFYINSCYRNVFGVGRTKIILNRIDYFRNNFHIRKIMAVRYFIQGDGSGGPYLW